jgi:PAS domain S-box-containing protein
VNSDSNNPALEPSSRNAAMRYGAAVVAVLLATLGRAMIYPWLGGQVPFGIFIPAVLIAALYGGTGPGLLATALSIPAAYFFFGDTSLRSQGISTASFLFINLLNLYICAAMRRAVRLAGVAVEARRRAEGALTESEGRFRLMADSAPVLIWIADTENRCVWFNQRWVEFIGRSMNKDLGAGWLENVHPDDRERVKAEDAAAFATRASYFLDYRLRRHDGEYRWVLEQGVPLKSDGQFAGYIGTCVDITDRKKLEESRQTVLEQEQAARLEAERASRIKDEFLATLSHELRTPLNAILGWSQIIRPGISSTDEVAEGLAIIQRNARMQTQIISDLLDMSRIISGKIRLEPQQIDLRTVIDASIESVHPSADVKDIAIEKTIGSVPMIHGDPARLQQAVWNLLTNAIKFTPRSGRVKVSLQQVDSQAQITVSDNGQGIGNDFLPHIFQRFRQADASTTRSHGGLGIGLSIVKSLVELHGGTVSVVSDGKGKGSAFTITLPIPADTDRLILRNDGEARGTVRPDLRGVKLLIVDDEPDSRDLIGRLLREYDATVMAVPSAEEALDLLKTPGAFDVLISDIGMPTLDGYDLIRELRVRGNRIPAMAVTAFVRSEDRTRCLMAGFQAHVAKPVDVGELAATVASLAGRTTRAAELPS